MNFRRFLFAMLLAAAAGIATAQTISPPSGYSQQLAVGDSVNIPLSLAFTNVPISASFSAVGLPPGLSVSNSGQGQGLISGISSQPGSFQVTVIATADISGPPPTATYYFDVFGITTSTLPNGHVGIPYPSQQLTSAGDSSAITWSVAANTLPPGLTLSSSGLLSGTPGVPGTFIFIITASDQSASFQSPRRISKIATQRSFAVTILPSLTISPATLPNGTVGTLYPITTLTSMGTGTLTWSLVTGSSLPPGLSGITTTPGLSAIITGTPTTAGTYKFTVNVIDSTGSIGTANYTVVIAAAVIPLAVTTTSLPAATIGTPYNATLTATGGTPAYTWSLGSGSLPAGLTLTPDGTITGTPAANAATSSFVVQVVGSDFASTSTKATANLSITVNPAPTPLVITTTALPAGTIGSPYPANTSLAATGGTPSYVWSVLTGALPAGLTLNTSTGAITGTPASNATTQTFTVQVKDSASTPATATANLGITINPAPVLNVTVTGSTAAGQQPTVTAGLTNTNPLNLNGTLSLTFVPSVGGITDDPNIQFIQANAAVGARQVTFTIPIGQTQATFTNGATHVVTGTVAGVITLTTTSLTDSNGNAVTPPAPVTITISPSAPVITKVTITSGTGTLTVAVTGFSPTRDMKTMTFHFVPTTGTTLAQPDVTVDVSGQFTTYYAGSPSKAFGSQFTVTVPFTFGTSGFPVAAVTVDMTNSQGTSARSSPANP